MSKIRNDAYGLELASSGKLLGPMPASDFLESFLPHKSGQPNFEENYFSNLSGETLDKKRLKEMVSTFWTRSSRSA
jgi:hypothetical protein